jgi:hypothetical protein
MTTITEYKVYHDSRDAHWVVQAETPLAAVLQICGFIEEELEHNIADGIFHYKTMFLGINGDQKFETISAVLV